MKSAAAGAHWNLKMEIDQAVLAFQVALTVAGYLAAHLHESRLLWRVGFRRMTRSTTKQSA